MAWESDSSSQLVGSAPQQDGRTSRIGERTEARPIGCAGTARPRGRLPRTQCTTVGGGGSPPSSPDRRAPDSDRYSTASETAGRQHRCRGRRGSKERKRLAPVRLDMLIFKSTDLGVEVMYTLWRFDIDAFLEQYDEASMHPHIFASLHGFPGKWAHMLDEGKDISVQDLLMHMERTFGNKRDYDAMIRTLYEVQQRDEEEEYMLRIHETVAVICRAYPDRLLDRGQDLKKNRFYHGLRPYLHDALSFSMAELPKREQACPTFDTLYTLAKKLDAGQLAHACRYTPSSKVYRDKHRHYIAPTGWVAALEEEGSVPSKQVRGEDSESEVEAVGGINVRLAQAMSQYQREERQCFVCGSPGHFARGCPHHEAFRQWHRDQASSKGALGEWLSRTRGNELLTGGECPCDQTGPKPTVGGGRAHCSLAQTPNAGRVDCGGQEFYSPSGQWQSGEYDHAHSGAAVRVPRPPSGRPHGLSGEPRRVRWDAHEPTRVCYTAHASARCHQV